MKKIWKKLLAVTLALSMTMSMVSMTSLAVEEGENEETSTLTTYCGKEAHKHSKDCYEGDGWTATEVGDKASDYVLDQDTNLYYVRLICEKEEHTHTLVCYMQWDEETKTLTINGTGTETVTNADVNKYKAAQTLNISNVALIEKEAFAEWKQLKAVNISNVGTIGYAFRSTSVEEVTIENVDTIETFAFYNPANLKKVTISNVKTVGNNIFNVYQGQTALTDVSLTNTDVGYQMFTGHNKLVNLTMNNVGNIGFQAFQYCTSLNLTSLDASQVKSLGTSAFLGCTGLTELTVDGVEIGNTAFYGCTGLTGVTVKNTTIGQQAFTGCTGLKTVTLDNITSIGQRAFSAYGNTQPACTALETVNMTNVTTTGNEAFVGCSSLKNVNMTNVTTIDVNSFASCKALETITIPDGVNTIGQYAFYNCTGLKTVTMGAVDTIDQYAFWNCSNLETIDSLSNVKSRIGGFAFYGCSSLTGLTVADLTKMGFIGSNDEIMTRVQAILAGKFHLDNAEEITELVEEDGWAVGAVDKSDNWNSYNNGTQLMEQARWQDAENGVAQVKVDAYYTGEKQMDYIFVADLSASMAQLGNPEDSNARFYDMQSKLLDMTGQLLNAPGYDCQVAIVTFGGMHQTATCESSDFLTTAESAEEYIMDLEPLNENTDYKLGLNKVLDVLESQQDGRNTTVIFLSDGAPTRDGENKITDLNSYNSAIAALAGQIKTKAQIYGVLHSPTASGSESAMRSMEAVCGQGNVYRSTDTESFGRAMNAAFAAVYGDNTVTIPVNAAEFDMSDLELSAGTAEYRDGVITWAIGDMPFAQHTLTYNLTLKDELANRVGSYRYDINNGEATFGEGKATIGLELELTLERTIYTVTYTDGANGTVFANQTTNVVAGRATPAFAGTPVRENYTFTGWSPAVAETVTGNVTYVAQWSRPTSPDPTYYTLTINYVDGEGNAVADTYTRDLREGRSYSVTSPAVAGMTPDQATVSGILNDNTTLTVIYTRDPEPAPTESPEESEDLNENDTPLVETPETSEPPVEPTEIPDEGEDLGDNDTPLAEVPQTGDMLWLWMTLAAASAVSLAWISAEEKKGKRVSK